MTFCTKGAKDYILYLHVNVEGGLLAMGDLHAVMGDVETGGCGLEINGEVTVRVNVIKDKIFPTPMVVSGKKNTRHYNKYAGCFSYTY